MNKNRIIITGSPTYENTIKLLSEADAFVDVVSSCLTFPKDSNPDKVQSPLNGD